MKPQVMQRRELLAAGSAAMLGWTSFPWGWARAAEAERPRLLYFTRSVEYEHSVVTPDADGQSFSSKILTKLGNEAGFDVECTKDGRVFDQSLDPYSAIVFYSCGNLYQPSVRQAPPMTPTGRERLLQAVASGKPFVALHSACYWGPDAQNDPYLQMVGGEFIAHGQQQPASLKVVSRHFPGIEGLGASFRLTDEWYALKNFAPDLHVILAQETEGMVGDMYHRPSFPATWARKHGEGRVFFTSMGHREDVWTNPIFQQVLLGGISWALGRVDAEITPNLSQVTPHAEPPPA
jgi:type 1 glutamine amidotransferase